jgi:hypothetical protein
MIRTEEIHLRDSFVFPFPSVDLLPLRHHRRTCGRSGFTFEYTRAETEPWDGPFLAFRRPEGFWAVRISGRGRSSPRTASICSRASRAGRGAGHPNPRLGRSWRPYLPLYRTPSLLPVGPAGRAAFLDGNAHWLVFCTNGPGGRWGDLRDASHGGFFGAGGRSRPSVQASEAGWPRPIGANSGRREKKKYVTEAFLMHTRAAASRCLVEFREEAYAGRSFFDVGELGPWLHRSEPCTLRAGHGMLYTSRAVPAGFPSSQLQPGRPVFVPFDAVALLRSSAELSSSFR